MYATATTTASIYNDDATTMDVYNYGTADDNTFPAATGVIMFLLEESQNASDPASREPRVIRSATGRLPSAYAGMVHSGTTRIKDERTGVFWRVKSVAHTTSPVIDSDVELTLDAVDAA
jgi:hypothetical protein